MVGDAVMIFANALVENQTFMLDVTTKPIECASFSVDLEENSSGQTVLNNMNNVNWHALILDLSMLR